MMIRQSILLLRSSFAEFNASKDYYKALGVGHSATTVEIKKAFYARSKLCHPDSNPGKESIFKDVNEAYQVLSSEANRSSYDLIRKQASPSHGSPSRDWKMRQEAGRQHRDRMSMKRDRVVEEILRAQKEGKGGEFIDRQFMNGRGRGEQYWRSGRVEDCEEILRMQRQTFERGSQNIRKYRDQEEQRREYEFQKFRQRKNVASEVKDKMHEIVDTLRGKFQGIQASKYVRSAWEGLTKKKK